MFEIEGEIYLQCIPCSKYYRGESKKAKKYNWSRGIPDYRTWERFFEHIQTGTHCRALSLISVKHDLKKQMELAKEQSVQNFHNRQVEEKLRCLNVVRNLYSTMLEHQSTRSLYSRLKCMDAYMVDLGQAITSKTQTARQIVEAQPTEHQEEELAKLEQLNESMPVLMKFIGDSLEENFRNRSVKIKNIKLAIGNQM